jgi:transaldolase
MDDSSYRGAIKLFADGADIPSIQLLAGDARIKGLTTNPSLMKKAGIKDYRGFARELLEKVRIKPISFEVFADDLNVMERQAREIATWGPNVYVKIPITNSIGESTIDMITRLSGDGLKLNITAVLTVAQCESACGALRNGAPSILSVFAGRVADTGRDPIPLMKHALEICRTAGRSIELLWASTREVFNIVQAENIGCDIITVPADILKKLTALNRDLTQVSLETVQLFKQDADSSGLTL